MRSTHRPPPVTVGRTEPEPRPPNATPRPFPALLARPALPLQTRVVVESRSRLLAAFSTGWAELARGARGRTGLTRDSSSARRTSLRDAVTPASSPRRRNAQPEPRAPRAGRAGSAAQLQSASPPHRPQHHEAPPHGEPAGAHAGSAGLAQPRAPGSSRAKCRVGRTAQQTPSASAPEDTPVSAASARRPALPACRGDLGEASGDGGPFTATRERSLRNNECPALSCLGSRVEALGM